MQRFPIALVVMLPIGCGGAASPTPAADVIRWAIGSAERAPDPGDPDVFLLVVPTKGPLESGTRATPGCLKATSFLPAPAEDPRIFFLIGSSVYVRRTPEQAPVPLSGNDPSRGVKRLLAFALAASPLQLLVAAKPDNATEEEIWSLTVGDTTILAARRDPRDLGFTNQEEFFTACDVPRCLSGGRSCLQVSSDGKAHYIDVEPSRGKRPQTLMDLGDVKALDAAWASADGQSLYVLRSCP